jgi:NhaP-type Na+/H+ or K+/H+ antiporter
LLTPLEACAFAALIVAVDPVATLAIFSSTGADPKLNALVFGESVLNDAVAIVLFKTIVQLGETAPLARDGMAAFTVDHVFSAIGAFALIFCGSVAIGAIGGCAIALLFKLVNLRSLPGHEAAPAELICLVCLSYATFLTAEYARLSGIVAALFSGAVCAVYVQRNLSTEGAKLCKTAVKAIARLCETIIFVLMGYGFWLYTIGGTPPSVLSPGGNASGSHSHAHAAANATSAPSVGGALRFDPCIPPDPAERVPMEPSFIVLTLSVCLISRGASVFPLTLLTNLCRSKVHRDRRLRRNGCRLLQPSPPGRCCSPPLSRPPVRFAPTPAPRPTASE